MALQHHRPTPFAATATSFLLVFAALVALALSGVVPGLR
jgi:hypothetical protein